MGGRHVSCGLPGFARETLPPHLPVPSTAGVCQREGSLCRRAPLGRFSGGGGMGHIACLGVSRGLIKFVRGDSGRRAVRGGMGGAFPTEELIQLAP